MDENVKIISILQSVKGTSHRAFCFTINKELINVRIKSEHIDIKSFTQRINEYKIIVIEDIDLTVHCITYNNDIISFDNMDYYYALFDILSCYMKDECRLSQESFHQECEYMQRYGSPLSKKNIEIRYGLKKEDIFNSSKRVKAIKVYPFKTYDKKLKNIEGSFVWSILKSFGFHVIGLVFWNELDIFGIVLDDYKILPLKLNSGTYNNVLKVLIN